MIRSIFIALFVLASSVGMAQDIPEGYESVAIQTSAECGSCKERIETEVAFAKGVKTANLNLDNKVLTVVFNPKKTSVEKLRALVAKTGYDADEVPANEKAYNRLPDCCQKGGHSNH